MTECLTPEAIGAVLKEGSSAGSSQSTEEHIATCDRCRNQFQQLIAEDDWWDDLHEALSTAEAARSVTTDPATGSQSDGALKELMDLLDQTDAPEVLGKIESYEIVELLGRGGMGAVFKAYDPALSRFVAIKMMLPHLAASGSARKRFAREARAAAAVVDDHVMAIHCVSQWRGIPFIVMTYSRGMSLQGRIDHEGALQVEEILRIASQSAKGLAAAHAQGLVHRDIKPANIFLDEGVERVQLMDFGLARAVDDASLTRTGTLTGTPQYMSPEQARAESVDVRSDLFSLGAVMYAMCTGRAPFRASSSYAVLKLIADEDPRKITEVNEKIPPWLVSLIGKLMSKQRTDRYQSAAEVAELLQQCLAHVQKPGDQPLPERLPPSNSVSPSPPAVHRTFAIVVAIVMCLTGTIFATLYAGPVPEITGRWAGEDWGTVVLTESADGKRKLTGTFTGAGERKKGTIELKWIVTEQRFVGSWQEGSQRFGKLSIRRSGEEITGAFTTSKKSKAATGVPKLAELRWRRLGQIPAEPSDQSPEHLETLLRRVIERCSAVRSGYFEVALVKGFANERGKPRQDMFHTYVLSGENWSKRLAHVPSNWTINRNGRLYRLTGSRENPMPTDLVVSEALSQREIDHGISPLFAGTIWSQVTLQFIRSAPPEHIGNRTINGHHTEILQWKIPSNKTFLAMPSANAVTSGGGFLRLYVAPQLGYALPRIDVLSSNEVLGYRFESRSFNKVAPDLYFPTYSSWIGFDPKPAYGQEYYFRKVAQVNEPIEDSEFNPTIEAGTEVIDAMQADHTVYGKLPEAAPMIEYHKATHARVSGTIQFPGVSVTGIRIERTDYKAAYSGIQATVAQTGHFDFGSIRPFGIEVIPLINIDGQEISIDSLRLPVRLRPGQDTKIDSKNKGSISGSIDLPEDSTSELTAKIQLSRPKESTSARFQPSAYAKAYSALLKDAFKPQEAAIDEQGNFQFEALLPAKYQLAIVDAEGKVTHQQEVQLTVADTLKASPKKVATIQISVQ